MTIKLRDSEVVTILVALKSEADQLVEQGASRSADKVYRLIKKLRAAR